MSVQFEAQILEKEYKNVGETLHFAKYAAALLENNEVEKAAEVAQKGVGLYPGYLTGYLVFAKCLKSLGNLEDAKENYLKALVMDPRCPSAYRGLVEIAVEENNPSDKDQYIFELESLGKLSDTTIEELKNVSLNVSAIDGSSASLEEEQVPLVEGSAESDGEVSEASPTLDWVENEDSKNPESNDSDGLDEQQQDDDKDNESLEATEATESVAAEEVEKTEGVEEPQSVINPEDGEVLGVEPSIEQSPFDKSSEPAGEPIPEEAQQSDSIDVPKNEEFSETPQQESELPNEESDPAPSDTSSSELVVESEEITNPKTTEDPRENAIAEVGKTEAEEPPDNEKAPKSSEEYSATDQEKNEPQEESKEGEEPQLDQDLENGSESKENEEDSNNEAIQEEKEGEVKSASGTKDSEIHDRSYTVSKSKSASTATLAEIYFQQGVKKKALDIYLKLLKREPENQEAKTRVKEIKASIAEDADQVKKEAEIPPESPNPGVKIIKRKR